MASIEEYKKRIQEFIYCLVRKDYQAVNNLMLANSVPIQDIRRVVKAFDLALSYQISDKQVDIYIPLWSEEEGQSDLTLSLSCFKNENKIKINDLEVL